ARHQHRIDDHIRMAVRARIFGIEVERAMGERNGGEERVIAGVERAPPMMLEDLALTEVLELVALRDELELAEIGIGHAPPPGRASGKMQDIPISQRIRKDVKRNTPRSPAMNASGSPHEEIKPDQEITLAL